VNPQNVELIPEGLDEKYDMGVTHAYSRD